MTWTTWALEGLMIVGGHCCPRTPAPFARGAAVLSCRDDPHSLMLAASWKPSGVSGEIIGDDQWRGLLRSFEAVALARPIPARPHAAVWAFTERFGTSLANCLEELAEREVLFALEPELARGPRPVVPGAPSQPPTVAVIDERRARALRHAWRNEAYDRAIAALRQHDLAAAELDAAVAFSLLPEPTAEDFALLSLVYSGQGRQARSDGIRELARNSRGSEFLRRLDHHCDELRRKMQGEPTRDGPSKRLQPDNDRRRGFLRQVNEGD